MSKTLNLAHRGFSGKYPENSPIAFKAAIEVEGCNGFESDVHLSKDNEPVIIHDPTLERTTDGKGYVKDTTYADLKKLDCGSWMNSKFSGQRIMHLEELIEFVLDNNLVLNLEVKNYEVFYENIEGIVINSINKLKANNSVFLSSFNHISMKIAKSIDQSIKAGLLYNHTHIEPAQYAKEHGIDAIHPRFHGLFYDKDSHLVKKAHALGIKVHTWTVNDRHIMKQCLEMGIDSIITNYPDTLADVMK